MGGVSAVADGAEAIERGNAECRGETAVGAATGSGFAEINSHFRRERLCTKEKRCADFAFERGAAEAAGYLEFCAAQDGFERF